MDKCPFCGAEYYHTLGKWDGKRITTWRCGTEDTDGRVERSPMCYEREIAALKEKVREHDIDMAALLTEAAELNEEMKSWRVYFKTRLDAWRVMRNYQIALSTLHPDHYKKLQDLGEI